MGICFSYLPIDIKFQALNDTIMELIPNRVNDF